MSYITTPETINDAPQQSQETLQAVEKMLGVVPNMFRLIANSPAAINGYVSLNGALGQGALDAKTRERIALAVAEVNSCNYCLAAHTYLGQNVAKLSLDEIMANRKGHSVDAKAELAVQFAVKVAQTRGQTSQQDIATLKQAGYGNAEIVEMVAHVALNTLTNYMNEVFGTDVDFPQAQALAS